MLDTHFRHVTVLSKSTSSLFFTCPLPANKRTVGFYSFETHIILSFKWDGKLPFLATAILNNTTIQVLQSK